MYLQQCQHKHTYSLTFKGDNEIGRLVVVTAGYAVRGYWIILSTLRLLGVEKCHSALLKIKLTTSLA